MVSDEQLNHAKEFFGQSIDFTKVKIKESRFVSGNRPWTCGNVIRVKKAQMGDTSSVNLDDLIHEFGHVWQHQHGQLVFLSALAEQLRAGIIRKFDPYNFGGPTGVAALRKLSSFFTESQAQIITEYWKSQHGFTADRLQIPFSQDYVQNLFQLVQGAQIGLAVPGKSTVASVIDSAVAQLVNWVLGIFE
jgi:phage-related tail fiber protein